MIAKHVQNLIQKALTACAEDGTFKAPCDLTIELEAPKVAAHGDLATNIAEDVVFLVEGRTIKHGHDNGSDQ